MKIIQPAIAFFTCIALFSCSPKPMCMRYYDNTKMLDGEIFGEELVNFFEPDDNLHVYSIRTTFFYHQLKQIQDSIKKVPDTGELDDGYYGFAFTCAKDTVFASYGLTYWRVGGKRTGVYYKNDSVKRLVKSLVAVYVY